MADGLDLNIDTSQWEAMLAALPERVARRAAREALQAGGDVLLAAMKEECPERTDTPTPGSDALPPGVLKYSLTDQVVVGKVNNPRVKVGAPSVTSHVAGWIENGFDHYEGGRKGYAGKRKYKGHAKVGVKGKHIDANPFMVRAFDSSIEAAVSATLESLGAALEQGADGSGDNGNDDGDSGATNVSE